MLGVGRGVGTYLVSRIEGTEKLSDPSLQRVQQVLAPDGAMSPCLLVPLPPSPSPSPSPSPRPALNLKHPAATGLVLVICIHYYPPIINTVIN